MAAEDILKDRDLSREFQISFARSSGPGGQYVNKVSTKVELRFHVVNSKFSSSWHSLLLKTVNRKNHLRLRKKNA